MRVQLYALVRHSPCVDGKVHGSRTLTTNYVWFILLVRAKMSVTIEREVTLGSSL